MSFTTPKAHIKRNERILALRGTMSFGLIARKLNISRNVVAGVCWRADWPHKLRRAKSPHGKSYNKIGTGFRTGEWAPLTMVRQP